MQQKRPACAGRCDFYIFIDSIKVFYIYIYIIQITHLNNSNV
jgi:hypothetical protein